VHCDTDYAFPSLYEWREGSGVCADAHKCQRETELRDTEIGVAMERPYFLSLNVLFQSLVPVYDMQISDVGVIIVPFDKWSWILFVFDLWKIVRLFNLC
jgi:hypothetical protein